MTPNPKPEPRAAAKARKRINERAVIAAVRRQVVERDGYCLIGKLMTPPFSECMGPSEWAHVGEHRRFRTVGQAPERRHTTMGSCMLCDRHHFVYDAHEFDIVPVDKAYGMDGAIKIVAR